MSEAKITKAMEWAAGLVQSAGLDNHYLRDSSKGFKEADLLREMAWVVLCSGFREKVVRRVFSKVSLCFFDWSSAEEIATHSALCVLTASDVFGSKAKLNAIAQNAELVAQEGFQAIHQEILHSPIEALTRFRWIGPITSYHLAKNLGFEFAKPDRHLQRVCRTFGFNDAQQMCTSIAAQTNLSVAQVDTIIWRICEMGLAHQLVSRATTA